GRNVSQPGRGRLPAADLLDELRGGDDAGIGAPDDVEGGVLDVGPEGGRGVLDHRHAVFPIHAADHRGEDADVGQGAGDREVGDAAGPEGGIEDGAVEAVVVALGDDELVGRGGELGDDVDVGFTGQAGGGR